MRGLGNKEQPQEGEILKIFIQCTGYFLRKWQRIEEKANFSQIQLEKLGKKNRALGSVIG